MRTFTVATRASRLAIVQTERILADIKELRPDVEINIKKITTAGDQDTSTALWKLEGTGFFTSQIETALLSGEADFAVHSFKDLPTCLSQGLSIPAMCRRQYPEDVLIAEKNARTINDLTAGAKVGTSSLRRRAQLKRLRPDIEAITIRGNVETRIRKVDSGEADAVILARAGLERLGLANRINHVFDPLEFVPAPAQGTLAIQTRADDEETIEMISMLNDEKSKISALAEREVLAIMEGGCHAPIGAYAVIEDQNINILAFVSDVDGRRYIKRSVQGKKADWRSLARQLADEIMTVGGKEILEELKP